MSSAKTQPSLFDMYSFTAGYGRKNKLTHYPVAFRKSVYTRNTIFITTYLHNKQQIHLCIQTRKYPIKTVHLPVCDRDRKRVRVGDVPSRRGVILVRHKIVVCIRIDQLLSEMFPCTKT